MKDLKTSHERATQDWDRRARNRDAIGRLSTIAAYALTCTMAAVFMALIGAGLGALS